MNKINFIFGIHCHQPIGNFDFVIEDAYHKAYLPFLETLGRFPDIKLVMHYSGCLLEWLEKNHPEYLEILAKLVEDNQVELLGGAFYEPIIPVIPPQDAIGQIIMMRNYLKERFGVQPNGIWLPERVWEPHLPDILHEAGIEYLVVDDFHFKLAGRQDEDLVGYFTTEHIGKKVNVFPISERLRYLIPFRSVQETIDHLSRFANESGSNLQVMTDDGEKFGIWPGTYNLCYSQGWVSKFFQALVEQNSWLELTTFSEYVKKSKPLGRIYLPGASYFEMSEWALDSGMSEAFKSLIDELNKQEKLELYKPFLQGGIWRNYLSKYPESNQMHKKMIWVQKKVMAALGDDIEYSNKNEMLAEFYRGQCNCAYWHGVFGGLYLPHLRRAIYQKLINAEVLANKALGAFDDKPKIDVEDFDGDGTKEIIYSSPKFNLVISPAYGGAIVEWDINDKGLNLINTLSRRHEAYHREMLKSSKEDIKEYETPSIHDLNKKGQHLAQYLDYDWHRRVSFITHFLSPSTNLDDYRRCKFYDLGDFTLEPFDYTYEIDGGVTRITMHRRGSLASLGGRIPFEVQKTMMIDSESNEMVLETKVTNSSQHNLLIWFGNEWNFALSGSKKHAFLRFGDPPGKKRSIHEAGQVHHTQLAELVDELFNLSIEISFDQCSTIWFFPVQTISQSESGFDKTYQGTTIFASAKNNIAKGESSICRTMIKITDFL